MSTVIFHSLFCAFFVFLKNNERGRGLLFLWFVELLDCYIGACLNPSQRWVLILHHIAGQCV